jgi:phosphoribosylaminoimidazolecarboxamide formyltransferase / IMP cyclohydrolase
MTIHRIQRAILSVSDKTGLVDFARGLAALGITLCSTGGTARCLRDAGLSIVDVAAVTGFPEMLDGRIKTLHPAVHGGLLAVRDNPDHLRQIAAQGIAPIDLLVLTLYPFEATLARPDASVAEAIEQIDIGGPAMLRSAAKNFEGVAVVVESADYPALLAELAAHGGALTRATRLGLARKAFAHVAHYDAAIAAFFDRLPAGADPAAPLAALVAPGARPAASDSFPPHLSVRLEKVQDLRYGENPHQRAALYRNPAEPGGLTAARQLQGKGLSYNNLLDLQAAWDLAGEFDGPAAVIVKHTNPCGAATGADLAAAYRRARETDPVSAFGGIIALNRPLDRSTAEAIAETFVEAVLAPGYAAEALAVLRGKKSLRLLEMPAGPAGREAQLAAPTLRRITGGMLAQDPDAITLDPAALRTVTRRGPTASEQVALRLAWAVAKHVRSNAIVLADMAGTIGVGAGQMSRVDAVRLAIQKACLPTRGAALGSDAFFPFRDGVDAAAAAGITAIIQPGGSVRDAEAIAAADEHGLAMQFTGIRHFRH